MFLRPALAASFYLLLVAPLLAQPRNDYLIEPGVHVGPINKDTTEEGLKAALPAGQVKRAFHFVGKTFFRCGTEVYSGTEDVIFVEWETLAKEMTTTARPISRNA